MRIVHLSDLHFGAVEPGRPEALRAAVTAAKPDLVVVSGDLSQTGAEAEMSEAMAFLRTLPQPQLIVPGNHDMPHGLRLWARFQRTFAAYQKVVNQDLQPVWRTGGVTVAGLNSAVPGGWYLDWDRGRISARQLIHLRRLFAQEPPDTLRVLVVHHPPAAPPGGTRRHLVDNRTALFGALNDVGIDLVLSGHFHISYAVTVPLPGVSPRSCVLSVTATATSHRLSQEPNGFHLIDCHDGLLDIRAWTWTNQQYVPATAWRFRHDKQRDWKPVAGGPA
ncbi:MAG TPA: metallophosphoesterase [Prosthecobacter sp.]|nr:metallophosphoesterase [Prosthecobacter sp.]